MPPLKSLSSFTADGCLVVADQGGVSLGTAFSAGHGSWSHAGGRSFDWTSVELLYSAADGSLIGYLKVSGRYTVNETGNAYTANSWRRYRIRMEMFYSRLTEPTPEIVFKSSH
jgi:hypothetical protein